ncbi:MAG: hypothetical protein RL612_714, partial [Actinomycetota bacterium]
MSVGSAILWLDEEIRGSNHSAIPQTC